MTWLSRILLKYSRPATILPKNAEIEGLEDMEDEKTKKQNNVSKRR